MQVPQFQIPVRFQRSSFHTVISILSFVSCGLNFIYSLLNIIKHLVMLNSGSFVSENRHTISFYLLFFQAALLMLNAMSFIGVLKMFNGKKSGLWLYIVGEAAPWLLFIVLLVTGGAKLGAGVLLLAIFGGAIFLVFIFFLLFILFLMDIMFIVFYSLIKFNESPRNFKLGFNA